MKIINTMKILSLQFPTGTISRIHRLQIRQLILFWMRSTLFLLLTLKTLDLFFEAFRGGFHESFIHNFIHLLHKLWKIIFGQTRSRNRR